MKKTFVVPLPIPLSNLRKAEDYTRDVINDDIQSSGCESVKTTRQVTEEETDLEMKFVLKEWMSDQLQNLIGGLALRFSVFERIFESNELFQSIFCENFPKAKAFIFRTVLSSSSSFLKAATSKIDVVNEVPPILEPLRQKTQDKLETLLKLEDVSEWEKTYKGEIINLYFECYFSADYGVASDYMHEQMVIMFRNYIVYFYKSLILFKKKWSSNDKVPERKANKNENTHPLFMETINSYENLKILTNFLQTKDSFMLVNQEEPKRFKFYNNEKILKEGVLLKRGDGPIDFNWNPRYFVVLPDRLMYFKSESDFDLRGTLSLENAVVGNIVTEYEQTKAFSIECAKERRLIWIAAQNEEEIEEWRKIVILSILRRSPYSTAIKGSENIFFETESQKEIAKKIKLKMKPQVNLQEESGAEEKSKLPRLDSKFDPSFKDLRRECVQHSNWEYYTMKDGVKIHFLTSQRNCFEAEVPFYKTRKFLAPCISLLIFLIVFGELGWIGLKTWIFSLLLVIGSSYNLLMAANKIKSISLKGSMVIDQKMKNILRFLTNVKNIEAWNLSFHRVQVKTISKFEASSRSNPKLYSSIVGEFGLANSGIEIYCKQGAQLETKQLMNLSEKQGFDCFYTLVEFFVEINQPKKDYADLIKEAEKQITSIALIKGEMITFEKNKKSNPINIGSDENAGFFLIGKPFLDQIPVNLTEEKAAVLKLCKKKSEHQNFSNRLRISSQESQEWSFSKPTRMFIFKQLFEPLFFKKQNAFEFPMMGGAFSNKSTMEMFCEIFGLMPTYLSIASEEKNHEMRFKLIISAIIGGLTIVKSTQKFFLQPKVGQTLQCFFADGSSIDFEQVSVNSFQFFLAGLDRKFAVYGKISLYISIFGNNISLDPIGKISVVLPPFGSHSLIDENFGHHLLKNEVVTLSLPSLSKSGLLFGNCCHSLGFSANFSHPNSNLSASIYFVNDGSNIDDYLTQNIVGTIQKDGMAISLVSGVWPLNISFDGVEYWNSNVTTPLNAIPANRFLPSDILKSEENQVTMRGQDEKELEMLQILQDANTHLQKIQKQK